MKTHTQLDLFPYVKPPPRYVPHNEGVKRLRAIRAALESDFTKNQDAPKKDR
jgi:hypothetical protein